MARTAFGRNRVAFENSVFAGFAIAHGNIAAKCAVAIADTFGFGAVIGRPTMTDDAAPAPVRVHIRFRRIVFLVRPARAGDNENGGQNREGCEKINTLHNYLPRVRLKLWRYFCFPRVRKDGCERITRRRGRPVKTGIGSVSV